MLDPCHQQATHEEYVLANALLFVDTGAVFMRYSSLSPECRDDDVERP